MDHQAAEGWIDGLDLMGMRFGLERMQALMHALGNPCHGVPLIHVVGTNGKSSVTRMTAAILTAHGVRTGAYLSPHITGWRERIALGGHDITPRAFAAAATRVAAAAPSVPGGAITQFEALTAIALDSLRTAGVDALVLEAGLGGRLDATNVLDPRVVVLTNVDIDHAQILGDTITQIAGEKLAVAPDGFSGLVIGPMDPARGAEVDAVIGRRHLSGWRVGQEITVRSGNGLPMRITTPNGSLVAPEAPLMVAYQRDNLAVAVGAAERLLGRGLDPEALLQGLARVVNPGRLQVIPGEPTILLDGAHNPAGARALAAAVPEVLGDVRPVAVIGMMADKDAEGICDALAPVISSARVTRASSGRAIRPEPIARMLRERGVPAVVVCGPAMALEQARRDAGPGGAVLVAGSLHLLADLAPLLGATGGAAASGTLAAVSGQRWQSEEMWSSR